MKIDPKKILIIPNYLDDEFVNFIPEDIEIIDLKSKLAKDSKLILYTSGFENRKNIPNLIQALRLLYKSGLQFRLIVTGDSKTRWMSLLGEDRDLLERITFVGFLTLKELKSVYCAADVVVYPSWSEGFGRACLEAMNAGTPLACSNLPVFKEIAGAYAEFFSPSNPHEIADALNRALMQGRRPNSEPNSNSHSEDLKAFQSLIYSEIY